MKVKIYELRDPRDPECKPRYVGITKNKLKYRLNAHIQDSLSNKNNTYKRNWIKSLLNNNIIPTIHLIEEVEGWEYACKVEQYWIKEFNTQEYTLTNSTDGGEGRLNIVVAQETKNLIKEIKSLQTNYNFRNDLNRPKIIEEYLNGESAESISKRYNVCHTTILKILIKNNIQRRSPNYFKTKIIQYDLNGNFLRVFENSLEVQESLNKGKITLTNLLRGYCKGFLWRKFEENYPLTIPKYTTKRYKK